MRSGSIASTPNATSLHSPVDQVDSCFQSVHCPLWIVCPQCAAQNLATPHSAAHDSSFGASNAANAVRSSVVHRWTDTLQRGLDAGSVLLNTLGVATDGSGTIPQRQIRALYSAETVTVYQAYSNEI